jgi:hypothetical protein
MNSKLFGVFIGLGFVLLSMTGCVEQQLKVSTDTMVPTLRHIQEAQVLDNLGKFLSDGDAVPIQVCISGGGVQAANQIQPSFTWPFHGWTMNQASLQLQGQWTENWSLAPVCDSDDMRRLRALYRYAVGVIDIDGLKNEYPRVLQKDSSGNPVLATNMTVTLDPITGKPVIDPATGKPKYTQTVTLVPTGVDPFSSLSDEELKALHNFARAKCANPRVFKGIYEFKEVWITKDADFDRFLMLVAGATPNTVSSGSGGGGGGGKGKPSTPLLTPQI